MSETNDDDRGPETPDAGDEHRVTGAGLMPGDLSVRQLVERMIRVDHAGEVGAVNIYRGQRAVLGRKSSVDTVLRQMEEQERRHQDAFVDFIAKRRVRPTALHPLWSAAGFLLGAGTALLGEKAAMACTASVEEAIEEHYRQQAELLGDDEPELREAVREFREQELEHRDHALEHGAEDLPGYGVLNAAIKVGTKMAIWLAGRV